LGTFFEFRLGFTNEPLSLIYAYTAKKW